MVHTTTYSNTYLATEDNLLTINDGMKEVHKLEHRHEYQAPEVITEKDLTKKFDSEDRKDKKEEKSEEKTEEKPTLINTVQDSVVGTYENLKEKAADVFENLKEKVMPEKSEEKSEEKAEEAPKEEKSEGGFFSNLKANFVDLKEKALDAVENVAETLHIVKPEEESKDEEKK
jgi:hypothetical protein